MKNQYLLLSGILFLFVCATRVQVAQSMPMPSFTPTAPSLSAKGYILIDANSSHVLAAKHADQQMAPASLTKMMSMYVISQALKSGQIRLDDKVRISTHAWRMGGSRMFVKPGTSVPVSDLIQGIIVDSGNDACVAMAEYVAGSEEAFVNLMNQAAAKLNLTHSHFMSSTGLPHKNHYSTANDLAHLAQALIRDFPEHYNWYKEKWFTYNKIKQPNRNRLLWRDPSVDGVKTGHTDEAGFCLVASAQRDQMRLISVVMGSPSDSSRSNDSQRLLDYGFRFFTTRRLYSANTAIAKPPVWFGKQAYAALGLSQDAYITLLKQQQGDNKTLSAKLALNSTLKAPIIKGNVYGDIEIYVNGKLAKRQPLIALENNPVGGWFSRVGDHISLFFHSLFGKKDNKKIA